MHFFCVNDNVWQAGWHEKHFLLIVGVALFIVFI